ncbi:MAG: acetamidase/formamidase family protein [Gammaproteobacteria bacterium]|nr:acetamidase/formamidase family protein [Gammaproteobacteria bacterium]
MPGLRIGANILGTPSALEEQAWRAGANLFFPVLVRGTLKSFVDAHGVQRDGEVALTAPEVPASGTVQIRLHQDRSLVGARGGPCPIIVAMGLHPDLDESANMATREMIDFLAADRGLTRKDTPILVSLAADLAAIQLVDGTRGVHAKPPYATRRR